jgi:hypothetical protein
MNGVVIPRRDRQAEEQLQQRSSMRTPMIAIVDDDDVVREL